MADERHLTPAEQETFANALKRTAKPFETPPEGEREKIVRWLRDAERRYFDPAILFWYDKIADQIERGDHLAGEADMWRKP